MNDHDWKEPLGQITNLHLAQMQNCTATGDSVTVKIKGFVKLTKDDSEIRLLRVHKKTLMALYPIILPKFRYLGTVSGRHATELEYLGDWTLEDALLGKAGPKPDAYFYKQIYWIRDTILLLSRLLVPEEEQSATCQAFLDSLAQALISNAQAAAVDIDEQKLAVAFSSAELQTCLCHNDFSVSNIICQPNGDARLIDPRWVTPGSHEHASAPFGSIAIDCASILISLERKELERESLDLPSLDLVKKFSPLIEELMANGIFNQQTFDLCLAQAYAVYCACRCDYCLSPNRTWLYEKMRQGLTQTLHRL